MATTNRRKQREPESPLMMPDEVFALIHVSRSKGCQLIRQGRIPGLKDLGGRCKRFSRRTILAWVNGELEFDENHKPTSEETQNRALVAVK